MNQLFSHTILRRLINARGSSQICFQRRSIIGHPRFDSDRFVYTRLLAPCYHMRHGMYQKPGVLDSAVRQSNAQFCHADRPNVHMHTE